MIGSQCFARISTAMNSFGTDPHGNVAVIFGIAILPVMITVGAAVDYSRANSVRSAMQSAVDATALALAKDSIDSPNLSVTPKARSHFDALFNRTEVSGIQVNSQQDGNSITVRASGTLSTSILGIVGINDVPISTFATVGATPSPAACVIALDPSANKAFAVSGSGSVDVPNCGIYVNSSANVALEQKGASYIKAKSIEVVGRVSGSNIQPAPKTNRPAIIDPLNKIPEPAIPGGCTFTNTSFTVARTLPANSVYCGTIGLNADVTFAAGIHYFKGATVTTSSSVNIKGSDLLLYFDATSSFNSSSSGTVTLGSMQSGTYEGIVIFGSRSANLPTFRFTGSKEYFLDGAIYLPKARLELYGSVDLNVKKSGYLIAQQFFYQGDSSLVFDTFGRKAPKELSARMALAQ
jgi:Flp pilus assembly protein TadG